LDTAPEEVPTRTKQVLDEIDDLRKEVSNLRQNQALLSLQTQLERTIEIGGIPLLTIYLPDLDVEILRVLADRFRQQYSSGIAVLGTVGSDGRPVVVATVSEDLLRRGLNAIELVKFVGSFLGGGGGGRPTLAQAGGKDPTKLDEALSQVREWVERKIA
jgi:alanyl-tRNA synthetase